MSECKCECHSKPVSIEVAAKAICEAEHPEDGLATESWQAWHSMYETFAESAAKAWGLTYVE